MLEHGNGSQNFGGGTENISGSAQPHSSVSAEEKMISQAQAIANANAAAQDAWKRGNQKGYERALEEAKSQWQMQQTSQPQSYSQGFQYQSSPVPQNFSAPTGAALTEEQIAEKARLAARDELHQQEMLKQQQALQNAGNEQANIFISRLVKGKETHQDFEQVIAPLVADLNLGQRSQLLEKIPELNSLSQEDMIDILYEMGKDPRKASEVMNMKSPPILRAYLQDVVAKRKQNADALATKQPKAPLDHIQSSNIGMGNGGNQSQIQKIKQNSKYMF